MIIKSTKDKIITKGAIERYSKKTKASYDETKVELLENLIPKEGRKIFYFNKGWLVLEIVKFRGKPSAHILTLCIDNDSKATHPEIWNWIKDTCEKRNLRYIIMESARHPNAWSKMFGFELYGYQMEYKI